MPRGHSAMGQRETPIPPPPPQVPGNSFVGRVLDGLSYSVVSQCLDLRRCTTLARVLALHQAELYGGERGDSACLPAYLPRALQGSSPGGWSNSAWPLPPRAPARRRPACPGGTRLQPRHRGPGDGHPRLPPRCSRLSASCSFCASAPGIFLILLCVASFIVMIWLSPNYRNPGGIGPPVFDKRAPSCVFAFPTGCPDCAFFFYQPPGDRPFPLFHNQSLT